MSKRVNEIVSFNYTMRFYSLINRKLVNIKLEIELGCLISFHTQTRSRINVNTYIHIHIHTHIHTHIRHVSQILALDHYYFNHSFQSGINTTIYMKVRFITGCPCSLFLTKRNIASKRRRRLGHKSRLTYGEIWRSNAHTRAIQLNRAFY